MQKLIPFTTLLLAVIFFAYTDGFPDLSKSTDLEKLGIGSIFEKDGTEIRHVRLKAVKAYWIEYIKDGSLHDKMMEKISRIEFPATPWGFMKITCANNRPDVTILQ